MKMAISTEGDFVSAHFGRCPTFTMVEIAEGKIVSRKEIANPGHHPGYLPQFFAERGVNCVVAGGAGRRAQNLFARSNIQLILGVSGKIDEVCKKLARGELQGGESLCQPGSGKGYGIEKTDTDEYKE